MPSKKAITALKKPSKKAIAALKNKIAQDIITEFFVYSTPEKQKDNRISQMVEFTRDNVIFNVYLYVIFNARLPDGLPQSEQNHVCSIIKRLLQSKFDSNEIKTGDVEIVSHHDNQGYVMKKPCFAGVQLNDKGKAYFFEIAKEPCITYATRLTNIKGRRYLRGTGNEQTDEKQEGQKNKQNNEQEDEQEDEQDDEQEDEQEDEQDNEQDDEQDDEQEDEQEDGQDDGQDDEQNEGEVDDEHNDSIRRLQQKAIFRQSKIDVETMKVIDDTLPFQIANGNTVVMMNGKILEDFIGDWSIKIDKNAEPVFINRGEANAKLMIQKIFAKYNIHSTKAVNGVMTKMYYCPAQCGHEICMESSRHNAGHNIARTRFQNNDHWDYVNLEPICSKCNTDMGTQTFCQYLYKQKRKLLPFVLVKFHELNGKYNLPKMKSLFQFVYTQLGVKEQEILNALCKEIEDFLTNQNKQRADNLINRNTNLINQNNAIMDEKKDRVQELKLQLENVKKLLNVAENELKKCTDKPKELETDFINVNKTMKVNTSAIVADLESSILLLSLS